MASISDELAKYFENKGLTQQNIAERLHVSKAYVNALFTGKSSFGKKQAEKWSNEFGLSQSFLLTGAGSITKDNNKESEKDGKPQPDNDHKDYETYLLPMTAAGGSLVGFDSDGAAAADCEKIISPIAKVSFAITVYGESMYPTYPSGSRVLIKKADPNVFIEWGTVYVLDTIDGIVIKEIHKSKDPKNIICHSINPKYDDFEINMSNVRGWYRVLASINIVHL
jgi:phage repressor protein C with HTH and peptisase S24 domain